MELYGVELAPWQIDLIFIIHNAVEGYYNEKQKKAMEKAKSKRKYKGLNPARDLEGDPLLTPPEPKHHKDVDMDRVGELFVKLKSTSHLESTKLAVFITFVTALRTNSVRNIRWSWIKKYKGLDYLEIPAQFESVNVMKNKLPFRCPLPKQALNLLDEIKEKFKIKRQRLEKKIKVIEERRANNESLLAALESEIALYKKLTANLSDGVKGAINGGFDVFG